MATGRPWAGVQRPPAGRAWRGLGGLERVGDMGSGGVQGICGIYWGSMMYKGIDQWHVRVMR